MENIIKKSKYYIKEALLFILIITVAANLISLYKSSTLNKDSFFLSHLEFIDGSDFEYDTTKPLLVHIWATWCPTCKAEASNIQDLSENYQVVTIAVKSGSNNEIATWLKNNNYNFNVLNDLDGSISRQFNVQVFPTTLVYNKDKELIFSDVGYTSTWGLYLRMWWASFN